jgi:hypothetical protein
MSTSKPLFTPTADGAAYDMQPAGVLLILADMVYGPQDDPAWTGRAKTEAMVQAMLAAAQCGRLHAQADILQTLLVRGERSQRIENMARAACAAAGNARLAALFASMRRGER